MNEGLAAYCPRFHRAVEIVGRRWVPEIVRALLAGQVRFSELGASIPGLSDRMLSERLKELEAEGIVTRTVVPTTPVRVEYRLTAKGEDLTKVVGTLAHWAETWVAPAPDAASAGPTRAPVVAAGNPPPQS